MGKRQHSKDTLYLRASEWKYERGGRVEREEYQRRYKRLPFDCCALSLRPFENPVATPEGIVFDIVNIVPYIKKHKKNPVTGEPLKLKQLKKLNYHKNSSGKYHCPLTFKEFSEHTHIVAVWTSGNVYAMEAIDELNFKPKHMVDLVCVLILSRFGFCVLCAFLSLPRGAPKHMQKPTGPFVPGAALNCARMTPSERYSPCCHAHSAQGAPMQPHMRRPLPLFLFSFESNPILAAPDPTRTPHRYPASRLSERT